MYLSSITEIADKLIRVSKTAPEGIFWTTHYLQHGEETPSEMLNNSLYNGNTGIALFFLELFGVTHNERYKEISEQAIAWEIHYYKTKAKSAESFAFLTGNMSLVYLLLRAGKVFLEERYVDQAEDIAKEASSFVHYHITDFINGVAGTLWCLLRLYTERKSDWLLAEIKKFTWEILQRLHVSDKGVYWDRNGRQIHGLCGFSHGASGVGYVLLEVGRFFDIPGLSQIGRAAFDYENQYFDSQTMNWQDFRKAIDVQRDKVIFQKAYLENDTTFFEKGRNMNMWCHGAAGIGLTRVYNKYVLGNHEFDHDLSAAITSVEEMLVKENTTYTHSLCHGRLGNLELFIQLNIASNTSRFGYEISQNIEQILAEKKDWGFYYSGVPRSKEDTSLFLGDAGVGYQLLRISYPQEVPSILLPTLDSSKSKDNDIDFMIDNQLLLELLIKKTFYRTVIWLKNHFTAEYQAFLTQNLSLKVPYLYKAFAECVEAISVESTTVKGALLREIYDLELQKRNMDLGIPSNAYLKYEQSYVSDKLAPFIQHLNQTDPPFPTHFRFAIDDSIRMIKCKRNWSDSNNHPTIDLGDSHLVVLQPKYWGIKEYWFEGPLTGLIAYAFKQEIGFAQGVELMLEEIDLEEASSMVISSTQVHIQSVIIDFIRKGIIRHMESAT